MALRDSQKGSHEDSRVGLPRDWLRSCPACELCQPRPIEFLQRLAEISSGNHARPFRRRVPRFEFTEGLKVPVPSERKSQ